MIHSYSKFIKEDSFNEDFKTYSIIGALRFLPSNLFWELLRASCVTSESLPLRAGELESIEMWPHWNSGNNTTNSNFVEPDVFVRFSDFDLIIEAKKTDFGGQYSEQWNNETIAYRNEYGSGKRIILLALGGNTDLNNIDDDRFNHVYKALWTRLLHAVHDCREQRLSLSLKSEATRQEIRVLEAIQEAFALFNEYIVDLLESVPLRNNKLTQLNINSVWPL